MKVSICIPTYNGEKYLAECLDSCLKQSFSDYEILVVDDGSSDGTISIVKNYQTKDSKIKLYQNEKNLGLVQNWNRCIELAQGEWIKFVFQDDFITSECLQKFWNTIDQRTELIVCKRNFILPPNASEAFKRYYSQEVRTLENTGAQFNQAYLSASEVSRLAVENICLNFIAEPSLAFFKKSLVKRIGPFNPIFAQICDLEFFQRAGSNYGLVYIPEKLCSFRIHDSSTTSTNLDAKAYILSHIEPILLVRQMLYDTAYEEMRKALKSSQLYKLKTYLKVRVYEAYKTSASSPANRESFTKVADKFVEIKKLAHADISTKLGYLLIQLKRKLHS